MYQGPPTSASVWPLGAVESCVTVKGPLALVSPALLVAVTVWVPVAAVVAPQV